MAVEPLWVLSLFHFSCQHLEIKSLLNRRQRYFRNSDCRLRDIDSKTDGRSQGSEAFQSLSSKSEIVLEAMVWCQ